MGDCTFMAMSPKDPAEKRPKKTKQQPTENVGYQQKEPEEAEKTVSGEPGVLSLFKAKALAILEKIKSSREAGKERAASAMVPPQEEGKKPLRKIIFRSLKITSAVVVFLVFIIYFYVTSSSFLEKTIPEVFSGISNGKISLKVNLASLFRGFEFEDIEILSGPDFDNKPLVQIKKLSLRYNVYGFFTGDYGVFEVGIYQPRIFLIQRNNVWNAQTLMKPGEPSLEKEKEPEEPKEEDTSEPKDIQLPFELQIFFKFILDDFHISIDGGDKSNSAPMEFGMKNFTFKTHILTKEFSRIPAGLGALDIVDTFLVQLNPDKPLDIYFRNAQASTKTPFDLHWLLALDSSGEKPRFLTTLKIGHNNVPVTYSGRHLAPLGINVEYNIHYSPLEDRLKIGFFKFQFLDDTWLNLTGQINSATKPDQMKMYLELDESNINLNKLYPYYVKFTNDRSISFRGNMSLAPLKIEGGMDDLNIDGKFKMKNVFVFAAGMPISIPFFDLYYNTKLNLQKKEGLPVVFAKAGWRGYLNGAALKADVHYIPQKKVQVGVFVRNLNPAVYSKGMASGNVNLALTVDGKSENHLTSNFTLDIPWLIYVLNRGKSGVNRIHFTTGVKIDAPDMKFETVKIDVHKIAFSLKNEQHKKAVWMNAANKVNMDTKSGNMDIHFQLFNLSTNVIQLMPTLTAAHAESAESATEYVRKDIHLKGQTRVGIRGNTQQIDHETNFILEDFDISDLWLRAKVGMYPKQIQLSSITLDGLNKALSMKIHGNLTEDRVKTVDEKTGKTVYVNEMVPDVKVALKFGKAQREKIFQDNSIEGFLGMNVHAYKDVAKGEVTIDKFYYDDGGFTKVNNINMNFPFLHQLKLKKSLNLTAANKERIIKNYNFSEPFNFSIESVEIENPVKEKESFKLLYSTQNYPGFGATMNYKDNVFRIPALQINILNGIVSGNDILFNVGRGKTKEMEYLAQIQVKDLDLKQLIPPDKAKAIKDGIIRMDMFVVGDNLDQPIENLHGYVSVYKIGEEFGKQGLKVVKPDSAKLVDLAIDNSIVVKKMDLDLKEGLVYAKVVYRKGAVGVMFISPQGDSILQDRIPIQEFFQRASKEAKVYSRKKEETGNSAQ